MAEAPQKLSRPSFEAQDAGLRLGTDEVTYEYDRAVDGEIAYETLILVPGQPAIAQPPAAKRYVMAATVLEAVAVTGAAGQAPLRRTGIARYRTFEQVA